MAAEVVLVPHLVAVPGAPAHLLGVFAHRGELVPVFDLSALLGPKIQASTRAVLARSPAGVIGLSATHVFGVVKLEGELLPMGSQGVQQHLCAPVKAPMGEVVPIEMNTFIDFLAGAN